MDFQNHLPRLYDPFEDCNLLAGDSSLFNQIQIPSPLFQGKIWSGAKVGLPLFVWKIIK